MGEDHWWPASAEWRPSHQTLALSDGWGVFDNTDHGQRIERWGDRFDSDAAATAYVALSAVHGSILCRQAFEWLGWHHSVTDAAEQEWTDVTY